MKSKTPFSIKLLKMNKKHHLEEVKRHAKLYQSAIKRDADDSIRLGRYELLRYSQECLYDLNEAIKKLSPKKSISKK